MKPPPQNLTQFPFFPEDPAGFVEQSVGAEGPDIMQYPTMVPGPPLDLVVPPNPIYNPQAAETDYYRIGANFLFRQHATQLLPVFHPHDGIPSYAGPSITEPVYPASGRPAMYRDQTEGHLPASSTTPSRDYEFGYAMAVFNFVHTCPPYQDEHRLPLDDTTRASPTVTHETDPPGVIDPPVSGSLSGMGEKETTGLPRGTLPPGTNNIESRDRKKRGSTLTPKMSLESSLGTAERTIPTRNKDRPRSDLRIVRQVVYNCGNTQMHWTNLPDIVFRVGDVDGMKLTDAVNTYFNGPDGRDELMFTNESIGSSFSCRMIFEGYKTCGKARPISTSNYKEEKVRITKKKLAEYVARRIKAYLKQLDDAGNPYPIPFENMFLTKLIHVSKASFQPEIWYQVTLSNSTDT